MTLTWRVREKPRKT